MSEQELHHYLPGREADLAFALLHAMNIITGTQPDTNYDLHDKLAEVGRMPRSVV